EDQMTPRGLVVRQDTQQDQRTHPGVEHRSVGQTLQRFVDRLAVDALADLGVVLDLDGQVAADRLHEQLVTDGNVRVTTLHMILTGGFHPREVVRGGKDMITFPRSEEHTSELQSRFDLVCRLLLEKKNKKKIAIETER